MLTYTTAGFRIFVPLAPGKYAKEEGRTILRPRAVLGNRTPEPFTANGFQDRALDQPDTQHFQNGPVSRVIAPAHIRSDVFSFNAHNGLLRTLHPILFCALPLPYGLSGIVMPARNYGIWDRR